VKVYVYPGDLHGCGHYRMIWPAMALQALGHDVVLVPPHARGGSLQAGVNAAGEVVSVGIPEDADVIVLQRITHRHLIGAIEIMRAQGVAVVMDIDDDLATIHPENGAFAALHPRNAARPDHNWKNAQLACEASTLVTVSTPALLRRYGSRGNGRVVRNCVPASYLDIPHVDSDVIGWGGSMHSHPNDPQVVGTAVARLQREGRTFRVVGPGTGVREALHLDVEPEKTGVLDLVDGSYPRGLAGLGVGIAPLADSRFNKSKSRLKPVEYAACGVPCVMSPRSDYVHVNDLGIGWVAHKPDDWYRQLRQLTSDEATRRELSEHGRDVARTLTIEGNAWRWLEVWDEAFKTERQNRPVFGRVR